MSLLKTTDDDFADILGSDNEIEDLPTFCWLFLLLFLYFFKSKNICSVHQTAKDYERNQKIFDVQKNYFLKET